MKRKRVWGWIALIILFLGLGSCGNSDTDDTAQPARSVSGNIREESEVILESTEVPMPEPTETPTPEVPKVLTPEPTEAPTPEPTPKPTEVPTPEPTQAPVSEPTKAYAVNDKNGKIHIVGECTATGNGEQAMLEPVYFSTYEEAEAYSVSRKPNLEKRRCGNCW